MNEMRGFKLENAWFLARNHAFHADSLAFALTQKQLLGIKLPN